MPASTLATARRALSLLDLTDLSDNADEAGLAALCARAVGAPGPVAAICIWPRFVAQARTMLGRAPVRIATVVNFPQGEATGAEVLAVINASPFHTGKGGERETTMGERARAKGGRIIVPTGALLGLAGGPTGAEVREFTLAPPVSAPPATAPAAQVQTAREIVFVDRRYWIVSDWLRAGSEHDYALNFQLGEHADGATTLRGEFGASTEVEISAVSVTGGAHPCLGFTIRDMGRRLSNDARSNKELPRSASQMTELVGRLPLKDIVRETTDLIEQLCIEAALELTRDNRASAAEMLGLSRQSLYVKLRRYGLGSLGGDE